MKLAADPPCSSSALPRPAHQQLAVEHRWDAKGFGHLGKAAGYVVAGAAVEPGLAAGMDQLQADAVPLPFGGIGVEVELGIFQRMGEHEGAKHRHVARGRLLAAPFAPGEQLEIGRLQPVPDLLHRLDIDLEGIGEGLLGVAGVDPDAQLPGGELEQRIAAGRVEMVEHRASAPPARRSGWPLAGGSTASLMVMVPSSHSPSALGHSSDTVSARSPT